MNVLILENITDEDVRLINAISKKILGDAMIVINVTDDDIVFNEVYNGNWFCQISNLPSFSNDVIEELIFIVDILQGDYGIIIGKYDSIINEFRYDIGA